MQLGRPDPQSVFLNVPYDPSYERIFVALVATLISLGRMPHCVLEISETGQGRMPRIMSSLSSCEVSIHDLSKVGRPARFNMPFELGIAYTLHYATGKHKFIIMEKKKHRLDITLSDLKCHDPKIHEGNPLLAISAIYEVLGRPTGNPSIRIPEGIFRRLWSDIQTIRHRSPTIFNRRSFNELIAGATYLARKAGVIR